jgi:hypothetical protein
MGRTRLHAVRPSHAVHDVQRFVLEHGFRRPVVFTRSPDAWPSTSNEDLHMSVLWCTRRPGPDRVPVDADGLLRAVQETIASHDTVVLDALPDGLSGSEITKWLLRVDDTISEQNGPPLFDAASNDDHVVAQWLALAPWLIEDASVQENVVAPAHPEPSNAEPTPLDEPEMDEGLHHLTTLPPGFSVDALRRRLLQWRRMGFDVSDLEPALDAEPDRMETLYRDVEQRVRFAIDLGRRLDAYAHALEPKHVERDRFRLRQLTGLADIASRLDDLEREALE